VALYGFQVGGLSDHHLPSCQANEDFVSHCFGEHSKIFQAAASGPRRSLFATNPKRILSQLSLAHAHGSTTRVYGATLGGGVEVAGRQLLACAIAVGMGTNSQVHAHGDGAAWIADQVTVRFGTQGSYTVDFLHVRDYLAEAAKGCAPDDPKTWLEIQKKRLKNNDSTSVLAALGAALEPAAVPDADAPVRACHRYLSNRLDHLDYLRGPRPGLAHRLWRNRKCPPLCGPTAPQARRRLVDTGQCRGHARVARHSGKRAVVVGTMAE